MTLVPIDKWWTRILAGRQYENSGDVLIVLAGSNLGGEFMGQGSYYRALYAVRAYRAGHYRHIVISGDSEPGTPISTLMRDYLVANGVPADIITVEVRSKTTRENALLVRPLLTNFKGPVVLLTSDYHMFRARRTFKKVGIEVLPQPIADTEKRATRWYLRWGAFCDLAVETSKISYYWMRGWI